MDENPYAALSEFDPIVVEGGVRLRLGKTVLVVPSRSTQVVRQAAIDLALAEHRAGARQIEEARLRQDRAVDALQMLLALEGPQEPSQARGATATPAARQGALEGAAAPPKAERTVAALGDLLNLFVEELVDALTGPPKKSRIPIFKLAEAIVVLATPPSGELERRRNSLILEICSVVDGLPEGLSAAAVREARIREARIWLEREMKGEE